MVFESPRALSVHAKAGADLPVYLLYGEEIRQIEKTRDLLMKAAGAARGSDGFLSVDGRFAVDWKGVADFLRTCPLTPGRRVAAVENLDLTLIGEPEKAKLLDLLARPFDGPVLILTIPVPPDAPKGKKEPPAWLGRAVDAVGGLCRFSPLPKAESARLARNAARKGGVRLDTAESFLLVDYCANDTLRLMREIEKLVAYRNGEGTVTREDIDALVPKPVDADVFRLAEAVLRRDLPRALACVDDLFFLRVRPETIVTQLSLVVVDLYRMAAARQANIREETVLRDLNYTANYRFRKAWNGSRKVPPAAFGPLLEGLADAEIRVKSANADGRTVVETAVASLIGSLGEG